MPPIKGRKRRGSASGDKSGPKASSGTTLAAKNVRWRDKFAVKATIFTAEQIAIMQIVDGLNNILHIDEGSSKVGNAIERGAKYLQSTFIEFDSTTEKYEDTLLNDILEFFGNEEFDEGLSDVTYMITYAGVYVVENVLLKKIKGGYSKGKDYLASTKSKAKSKVNGKVNDAQAYANNVKDVTVNLTVDAAVRLAHGSKYLRVNTKMLINKLKKKGSISKKDLEDATGKVFNKEQTKRFYDFIAKLKPTSKKDRTKNENIFSKANKDNMSKHNKGSGSNPFTSLPSGKGIAIAGSVSSVSFGIYTLANFVLGESLTAVKDGIIDDIFTCGNLLHTIASRLKTLRNISHLNQSHVAFDLREGDEVGEREMLMRLINVLVNNIISIGSDKMLHIIEPLKLMLNIIKDVIHGRSANYMLHYDDIAIYADIINASQNGVAFDNDPTYARTMGVLPLGLPNIKSYIHFLADNTTNSIEQFLRKFTVYNSQFPLHQDEIEVPVSDAENQAGVADPSNTHWTSNGTNIDGSQTELQIVATAMMSKVFVGNSDVDNFSPEATKSGKDKEDLANQSTPITDKEAAKLSSSLKGMLT